MFGLGNKKKKSREATRRSGLPVTRYYNSKKPDNLRASNEMQRISRDKPRKTTARLKSAAVHLPQILLLGAIVVILLANTTLSGLGLKIPQSGFIYRSSSEYQDGIEDIFGQSLFNNSKITFSASDFEKEVLVKFPELGSASAVVPLLGRRLQIGLSPVAPLVRFSGVDRHLITKAGLLVKAPSAGDTAGLAIFTIQPEISPDSGDKILTSTELELISLLLLELDGSSVSRPKVNSINFSVTSREMRVRFTDQDYFVKFTPEANAAQQIGALIATLEQIAKEQGGDVVIAEYVDARVGERIFVK